MMASQPTSIKLIMQNGPSPGQIFTISSRPQVTGRGQDCQIVIIDKTLSRQHARIWATTDGLVVEDLGSTNGTYVNDQRISRSTLVLPGDVLRLGENVTFSIQAPSDIHDTVLAGAVPTGAGQTFVPSTPLAPVSGPTAPTRPGFNPWIWVGVAVIIAVLIVGGTLGYLYYARILQATPPPAEVAVLPTPTQTSLPTDTPVLAQTPTPSPTFPSIQVPGVSARTAREQPVPADVSSKIDPFCNQQLTVAADEPVLITWQRRLAQADDQVDFLAEWLDAVYFDLTLDGRPIGTFNYQQNPGLVLDWWANVGLLPPGKHYLRIEWYTNRPVSNGLDVEPADGVMDVFGPGLAGEGSCEIIVPEEVAAATPTVAPTFTPTPIPTPTPQPPSVAPAQSSTSPAPLGIFQDFESPGTWQRGDQPYGDFSRSSAQVHSGSYAGQLSYNFPSPDNDYVVFMQSRALAGQPNAISAWVYGDGSGHFLNVWIRDANGQTWAMSFGQVKHHGWQEMTAYIDPSQPWPSGHISGPDNGVIDYPISFQALVLDDGSDNYSGQGTIYLDDLNSQEGIVATAPTSPPGSGVPAPGGQQVPANSGIYTMRIGNQHRYEEPWGAPVGGNPCRAWENNSWDDEHPNYRGFNVEILLTNNSAAKVQDDWGENMHFFTASGGEVTACYYGYAGAGPPPGSTTSLTFFSVVSQGDYVQVMQLNLNGQFLQLCLDGRGGWSACN